MVIFITYQYYLIFLGLPRIIGYQGLGWVLPSPLNSEYPLRPIPFNTSYLGRSSSNGEWWGETNPTECCIWCRGHAGHKHSLCSLPCISSPVWKKCTNFCWRTGFPLTEVLRVDTHMTQVLPITAVTPITTLHKD